MKRKLGRALLFTIGALGLLALLPGASSGANINLTVTSEGGSIKLGQTTTLWMKINGVSQEERQAGTMIIRAAGFPYKTYRAVRTITGPLSLDRFRVRPETNTSFQVSFVSDNFNLTSRRVVVYVNPIVSGGGLRSYRNGLRFQPGTAIYSRSLYPRWTPVPRRLRTVYFYQQCKGSTFYELQAKKPIKATISGKRMKLLYPGYNFTHKACDQKGFWPLIGAASLASGYLPNGDDGTGEPRLSVRHYKRWVKWAGRKRIPARLIDPIFYR